MRKVPSLFMRDYEGNRQVFDKVVEGSEWVLADVGQATVKHDGTACMIKNGVLHKRYDRKRDKKTGESKPAPEGWMSSIAEAFSFERTGDPLKWVGVADIPEDVPDVHTGHWPGWLPVGVGSEDKWHRAAWEHDLDLIGVPHKDGTYELVGPKVQSNPYNLSHHTLWRHGGTLINAPRTFEELKTFFRITPIEGIVWHRYLPYGGPTSMVKIKRRDFGFDWPVITTKES